MSSNSSAYQHKEYIVSGVFISLFVVICILMKSEINVKINMMAIFA